MQVFDDVFRQNYTKLYFHALSFLHDNQEACDTVNDVFEWLWRNFDNYRKSANLLPLLYTLVRNKCVDQLRRRRSRTNFLDNLPTDFPEQYDYENYEEKIELVRQVILSMPEQTRRVFMLRYAEELPYRQIAERLEISTNTVKTHLAKAMQILRRERKRFSGIELVAIAICFAKFFC